MLEPSRSGVENVLVTKDVFSKYTLTVPTRDQWAETVALVTEWFYINVALSRCTAQMISMSRGNLNKTNFWVRVTSINL